MITVVSENTMGGNCYTGLSLAEACAQLQIDTVEVLSEMNMDILLTEHAYLHENGCEIEYFDEAGTENKHGAAMKARITNAIHTVSARINELMDKCITWVQDHLDAAIDAFARIGLSKKNYQTVMDALHDERVVEDTVTLSAVVKDYDGFKRLVTSPAMIYTFNINADDAAEHRAPAFYDEFVEEYRPAKEIQLTRDKLEAAAEVVFNRDASVMHDIRAAKKTANGRMKVLLADTKKAKNDNMGEELSRINDAIKMNSKIASDAIKVYHLHVSNSVAMLRALMKSEAARKVIKDTRVAAVKGAPAAAKNSLSQHLADAKMKHDRAQVIKKSKKAEAARKKAVGESVEDLYDGNFFRV